MRKVSNQLSSMVLFNFLLVFSPQTELLSALFPGRAGSDPTQPGSTKCHKHKQSEQLAAEEKRMRTLAAKKLDVIKEE